MVRGQETSDFTVKTDEQGPKLIEPGKRTLTDEATFVDLSIKQTFTTAFGKLPITLVFGNVGHNFVIEADFTRVATIKSTIGIEEGTSNGEAQFFHRFERGLKMFLELEGVIVVTGNYLSGSDHVAVTVHNGQNVRGFGLLASLIS